MNGGAADGSLLADTKQIVVDISKIERRFDV
jgi:hypothetical protein